MPDWIRALPGGFVYINCGAIEQADRLDELASKMMPTEARVYGEVIAGPVVRMNGPGRVERPTLRFPLIVSTSTNVQ